MQTMVIVLLAYSVGAYIFSGLTCYLAFLKQSHQDSQFSKFNLNLLSHFWVVGLWPLWITIESFGNECNDDTNQERPVTNFLLSDQTADESCRQGKHNWN